MSPRSSRNKTLVLTDAERARFSAELLRSKGESEPLSKIENQVLQGEVESWLPLLPDAFVDLLILDPPYNLDKDFRGSRFVHRTNEEYLEYLRSWLSPMMRLLKPTASVYLCGDWRSSAACQQAMEEFFLLRNRITWQREKGRGASGNWKSCHEDIWYGTCGREFVFHLDQVKVRRRVLAPYRDKGVPKDWMQEPGGEKTRMTCPSNLWDDITVPFWSMPENTPHPTQKPEKLLAKLILASSNPGDLVFDPFLGSGTTAVVARKLGRRFVGVERQEEYCLWALKRLDDARGNPRIQGYEDGIFYQRNR